MTFRTILLAALSILPFGLVACDVPDESCNCAVETTQTKPEPEPEPAEFGDGCENDSECANDDGNLVCSGGSCTPECDSWQACSRYNFELNGYTIDHTCDAGDDGRFVCVTAH